MSRRIITLVVALASAVLLTAPPGVTQEDTALRHMYASGPGEAQGKNYLLPALVVTEGDSVTYVNADAGFHDVVSLQTGPDRPWCTVPPFAFESGLCPLFASHLIGLALTSDVFGLSDVPALPPGEAYLFKCSIHPWMQGRLVVVPRSA